MFKKLFYLLSFTSIYSTVDSSAWAIPSKEALDVLYEITSKFSIEQIKFFLAKRDSKTNAYVIGMGTNNQLNNSYYWPMYVVTDYDNFSKNISGPVTDESMQKLADFIEGELSDQTLTTQAKIQKQFIFLCWMSRILVNDDIKFAKPDLDRVADQVKQKLSESQIDKTFMDKNESAVYEVMSQMFKQKLWTDTDIMTVLTTLEQIYSSAKLQGYGEDQAKLNAWDTTIKLLKNSDAWPEALNLEDKDKFQNVGSLSWFTSKVISIEAKRAMIRALLTKIRRSKANALTKSRYTELTGKVQGSSYASTWSEYGSDLINKEKWSEWISSDGLRAKWKSYTTYLQESIWNSTELKNYTTQDGYLDQVITLFLLFVRDILGIDKSVGGQRDNVVADLSPGGYGSIGYSKQDNPERQAFVKEVKDRLADILIQDKDKIVVEDTPKQTISFTLRQPKVYYLAELANAFYQFMSAEMDKTQLTDPKQKDDKYIKSQEESNLGYLRKWFIRTRSIHPIISWLFQNYNPHMSQKISFSAAYWYNYCFMSDWTNLYGGETIKRLISQVFDGLGEAVKAAKEIIWSYWSSIFPDNPDENPAP